ncbi:TetR/AcrR family transcriptional regulator [Saccharopolyspora sp. NPDC049426]|uniref:TetR/AcrR family transcriptional regulator n=1 Tax=Saccharopolyspora sp. NPDC049426 TaxID=3155652 RepID=UPI003447832C
MKGRPRDPAVGAAIRQAALDLVKELGYRGTTMEGIAHRSGASKQAVYRRYSSKGDVLLDALDSLARETFPEPDSGSLHDDLLVLVRASFAAHRNYRGAFSQALVVEAAQEPAFAQRAAELVLEPRRQAFHVIFNRARERGEATYPNNDELIDLILGPMWYALLFDLDKLTDSYAESITRVVVAAARSI